MKIYISSKEAEMLHHAISEFMLGVYGSEDEGEGSSAFSKRQIAAIENFEQKLLKAFG